VFPGPDIHFLPGEAPGYLYLRKLRETFWLEMGTRALVWKPHTKSKGIALPGSVCFVWAVKWLGVPTGCLRSFPNSAT